MGWISSRTLVVLGVVLTAGCPKDDDQGAADTGSTGADSTTTGVPDPTTGEPADDSTTMVEDSSTGEIGTSTGEPGTSTGEESSSSGEPAGLPDIDMLVVQEVITESAYTQTVTFAEDSCALEEACVDGPGERRLLRFDTWTPNVGESDLVVGSPDANPELFEYAPCHAHYHFIDFADYRLLDAEGNVAAAGHKQSFALIDFAQFSRGAGPGQYPLPDGTQGITAGWADIYGAYLDCQWVDITGVLPGEYTLEINVNPEQHLEEASYDNNLVLIPVTIGEEDDVGPVLPAPDEWTCPDEYYSTNDGCDCGCGAVDPDCDNPTAAACEYCDGPGSCANSCADINATNNAICD